MGSQPPEPRREGTPPPDASFDYARAEEPDTSTFDTVGDEETVLIDGRTLRGAGLGVPGANGPTGPSGPDGPLGPTGPEVVGAAQQPTAKERSGPAPAPDPAVPAEPHPAHHSATPQAASGLRALSRAQRTPRARGPQLLIAVLCGLLGFFAVVQVRSTAGDNNLRNLRQGDLIRILDDLNDRSDRLDREIRELQARRAELSVGTDSTKAALEEAIKRRSTLGILAGTVPARGPGITLRIADPGKKVDAPVLLDALQELRDAGAEAVQINDVRVVASTSFLDADAGSVRIDGKLVSAPYVFKVIGDPATLDPALRIPGGVFSVLNERGATPTVAPTNPVLVDAVVGGQAPQYVRPVQPQS